MSKPQTLKQYVHTHLHDFIYVGAQSSFIYIGRAGELTYKYREVNKELLDRARESFQRYSDEYMAAFKHLPVYKKSIEEASNTIKSMSKRKISDEVKDEIAKCEKQIIEFQKRIERCKKVIADNPDKIKQVADYMANYVNIEDRVVLDVWEKDGVEPYGTAVKIEGTEQGTYWFHSEYLCRKGQTVESEDEDEFDLDDL